MNKSVYVGMLIIRATLVPSYAGISLIVQDETWSQVQDLAYVGIEKKILDIAMTKVKANDVICRY